VWVGEYAWKNIDYYFSAIITFMTLCQWQVRKGMQAENVLQSRSQAKHLIP
jgi:cytochrome oxidase assembly protein ShyY1